MKKLILCFLTLMCAIPLYGQAVLRANTDSIYNAVYNSLLLKCFDDFKIYEADNVLEIRIRLSKEDEEVLLDGFSRLGQPQMKARGQQLIDSLGGNSEPYRRLEFMKDIYAEDNPFFISQISYFAYLAGVNPLFKDFANVFIVFESWNGTSESITLITDRMKDIIRKLAGMGLGEDEITLLVSEKYGLDAGVIVARKSTPIKLDFLTVLRDIELEFDAYIYNMYIPGSLTAKLSVDDFIDIRDNLVNTLGAYTSTIGFFKLKGAEVFGLKIVYVYRESDSGKPLIKYVFDPYTGGCETIPVSQDVADKFAVVNAAGKDSAR